MDINLKALVIGVLSLTALAYFTKKSIYAAEPGKLRFGSFIKGLGLACLVFSVIPLAVLLTGNYEVDKPGETTALIGLILGFGVLAIGLIAEGFFVKGSFSEESIHFKSPWTGTKDECWSDLESLSFNRLCQWYTLEFDSGAVIRISTFLGGHTHLLQLLQAKGHDIQ